MKNMQQQKIIDLVSELENELNQLKSVPNEFNSKRYAYLVVSIATSLTKLLVYYNREIQKEEIFWFSLSRSIDEDFRAQSRIYINYNKLVDLLKQEGTI